MSLETPQPLVEIQLDIASQESTNVNKCMEEFFKRKVSGWKCNNCNEYRDAVQNLLVVRAPQVLVVVLRRFQFDFNINQTRKLNTMVHSELQVTLPTMTVPYELVGVVNHIGLTANTGHYTANCRLANHQWMKFSDELCVVIKPEKVITSDAYLLFFSCSNK